MDRPEISIVAPVFNEAESIAVLHSELLEVLTKIGKSFEIIFIDDGSTDHTLLKLKKLKPIRVISFSRNFGKSQALQAGFDAAKGTYIITLDSDLQDDPHEIPKFLAQFESGADLICGWKQNRQDPFSKVFLSRIANAMNRFFSGVKVHDMDCCFKGYRRDVAKTILLHGDMHRYIPSIAASFGFTIREVKINHRARQFGKSKYGFGRIFRGFFDFLTILFLGRFISRPMHFFGIIGLSLSGIGFIILAYLTYLKLFWGVLIGSRPFLLFGVLLVLVGFQSFSLGLLGELIVRQNNRSERNFVIRESFEVK